MTGGVRVPLYEWQLAHPDKPPLASKMFRKLTDRISAAANAMMGRHDADSNIEALVAMGFEPSLARQALEATQGNVEQAAELLLASSPAAATTGNATSTRTGPSGSNSNRSNAVSQATMVDDEEELVQRVLLESLQVDSAPSKTVSSSLSSSSTTNVTQSRQPRTAAMNKAAEAAAQRAMAHAEKTKPITSRGSGKNRGTNNPNNISQVSLTEQTRMGANSTAKTVPLSGKHPAVRVIPKLQDKSKEEQIMRTTDRLKFHPQAVDTLHLMLTAVQSDPGNAKFRTVKQNSAGYQRALANVPGAEDLLLAMSYRRGPGQTFILDSHMIDPALLYLGISALEQIQISTEYRERKDKINFAKEIKEVQQLADISETEAIQRAALMAKCPSEPEKGQGALMQVVMAEETVRRRFDGDDTLEDVLNWLGGHGSVIPNKILNREWSLVDTNRYPIQPIDCQANKHNTLQFIGCWPSGRLELLPSTEEWTKGMQPTVKVGSSRGLASAPSEVVYS